MVTIVKGNEKIICSYKTYDDQYRQLGYVPVSEPKKGSIGDIEVKVSIKEDVEELVNDIIEKNIKILEEEKEQNKTEDEKIGAKYGTRKRTTSKSKKGE